MRGVKSGILETWNVSMADEFDTPDFGDTEIESPIEPPHTYGPVALPTSRGALALRTMAPIPMMPNTKHVPQTIKLR